MLSLHLQQLFITPAKGAERHVTLYTAHHPPSKFTEQVMDSRLRGNDDDKYTRFGA
jgi:hypothetical protein